MNSKKYEIQMDIYKGVLNPQDIKFVTEDNGQCTLNFKILEDKMTPYNLTNCIVRMLIDGQQQDCTIINAAEGTASINLLQSMFAIPGDYKAELQIYNSANQTLRLTTPTFRYNVRQSMMDDDTVQADPNFSILQDMIINVSNANDLANQAKSTADSALATANTAVNNVATIQAKGDYAKQQGDYAKQQGDSMIPYQQEITHKVNILDALPPVSERVKNGFYSQNRDVVRDGLVDAYIKSNKSVKCNNVTDTWTVTFNGITSNLRSMSSDNGWYIVGQKINLHVLYNGAIYATTNTGYTMLLPANTIKENERFTISVIRKVNNIYVSVNGKGVTFNVPNNVTIDGLTIGHYEGYFFDYKDYGYFTAQVYNRPLSQQEIKYNFDSMGTDKIGDIENSEGRKYEFAPKAINTFFKSGMNLERAMNQFVSWKTLTMGADGTFPATKCADWYSDRYNIKGNTVKNYLKEKYVDIKHSNPTNKLKRIYTNQSLESGKTYKLVLDIKATQGNPLIYTQFPNSQQCKYTNLGINIFDLIPSETLDNGIITIAQADIDVGKWIEYDILGLFETLSEAKSVKHPLNGGLSSVGTTTVDGKTCLSYSVNGVENYLELPHPLRKWDTLKDNIDTIGTKEKVLDGSENWQNPTISSNTIRFGLSLTDKLPAGDNVICNNFITDMSVWGDTGDTEGIFGSFTTGSSTIYIRIGKSKLPTQDVSGFKAYLKAQKDAGTPVVIQYQLAQPISREIKSTFAYGPDSSGNADIRFTTAVTPASAELKVAQTADQVEEERTKQVNSLNAAVALLQQQVAQLQK